MGFQAVPDAAEIDVIYTLNGVLVQNVFYGRLVGGYALSDLQALADNIDAQIQGTWKAQQPNEALYLRTEVRGLASENDQVAEQNFSAGAGVHGGSALPNNVTFSVKKTSGFTGRSARGRTYWIGIPDNERQASNENFIVTTYSDALVAAVDSIRVAIENVGLWEPVLVSRFSGGLERDFGVTFPWVGSSKVDNRLDTQRGRLPD